MPNPTTTDPTPNREQRRHPDRPAAYSPDAAAQTAGVSRSYIYDEMTAGRLASRHAGRRRLILAADLDAWLEALPAA